MFTGDVLSNFPGLPRDTLYRWTKQGYLQPRSTTSRSGTELDYTPRDVQILEIMWPLYGGGTPPKTAYEKAVSQLPESTSTRPQEARLQGGKQDFSGIDGFVQNIFSGQDLTMQQILMRAINLLNTPPYLEVVQRFAESLPIEAAQRNRFRYRRKLKP